MPQVKTLLEEAVFFFQPVRAAVRDPEELTNFLRAVGFDLDLSVARAAIEQLDRHSPNFKDAFDDLMEAAFHGDGGVEIIRSVFTAVTALSRIGELQGLLQGNDVGLEVVNLLAREYLNDRIPSAAGVLKALGVLTETAIAPGDPGGRQVEYVRVHLEWERLALFLSNTNKWAYDVYGWNGQPATGDDQVFDHQKAIYALVKLFEAAQLATTRIKHIPEGERDVFIQNVTEEDLVGAWLPLFQEDFNSVDEDADPIFDREAGLRVMPFGDIQQPETLGLALAPYVKGSSTVTEALTENITLTFEVNAQASGGVFIVISPADSNFIFDPNGSPGGSANASFSFEVTGQKDDQSPIRLLGDESDPTLSADAFSIRLTGRPSPKFTAGVKVDGLKANLTFESDSFLSSVLPASTELSVGDIGLAWSSTSGVHFIGGNNVTLRIPTNFDVGPTAVSAVHIGIQLDGEPGVALGIVGSGRIGPLHFSVDRIGLLISTGATEQTEGFLPGVAPSFLPPRGLGLAIDTGPVTGGGYLEFFPDEHRYIGTFDLQIGDLGVTVVGLLQTKLPGTKGYSLLLLITADLPPIQLGFGFTLTGIGGLAGVHRAFEVKPLGKAVRSGNLDSVLFPEDVVANANQIVTDLETVFPARPDLHVFGPMLEVGWGTPSILEMQIGVLVALPKWKIALLGKIAMALPDDEAALIEFNLAILGVLDLPNQEFSIDASLYDSRIAMWTVSGDMAMRLAYGDDPRFLLSVGGFHPRYTPETGFPELRRVKASLAPPGGNPRLELTGYLAITSNTFQVGAALVLEAKAGPAGVYGKLSFDALFQFSPFKFIVDFYATLKIHVKGKGFGISVRGSLSGPQPFRVRATVHIEILFFEITVRVNAKIGPSGGKERLPTARVLPKLVEELTRPANWTAQQPERDGQLVTLRDPNANAKRQGNAPEADVVLVHPLGTLGVRQQIVPLGIRIEKFGNARPVHSRFDLERFTVQGTSAVDNLAGQDTLREKFAPASFRHMTDDEKLQARAFEDLPAGRRLVNGLIYVAGATHADEDLRKEATLAFEASVIDRENEKETVKQEDVAGPEEEAWTAGQPAEIGDELAKISSVATAGTRTKGTARYRNDRNPVRLSVSDDRFVVVRTASMQRLEVTGNPARGRTRVEAIDAMNNHLAAHPEDRGHVQVVGRSEVAA